jgi:protein-L-isoaspartate(D-aspartate) O-methyltransferase
MAGEINLQLNLMEFFLLVKQSVSTLIWRKTLIFMYREFQQELLSKIKSKMDKPLPEKIETAFLNAPRHLFVKEYIKFYGKESRKIVVEEQMGERQLHDLYDDDAVTLQLGSGEYGPASISQPSLVLYMLALLDIEPGQRILEIGAASGWNAAMMGELTGREGRVHSIEINNRLADLARQAILQHGIDNVTVIEGDGGFGYDEGGPFDRIVVTAGSFDIPSAYCRQLREGGLLLIPLKNKGGGDNLFLFRKSGDHLESEFSLPCAFVPLTGTYKMEDQRPIKIASIDFWADIENKVVYKQPFWWGSKSPNIQSFVVKTRSISSFLSITEPLFEVFGHEGDHGGPFQFLYFGIVDYQSRSIAVFKDDMLIAYGNDGALVRLRNDVSDWVEKGMPAATCFELKVYPIYSDLHPGDRQWLVKKRDSQFLWTFV